MKKGCLLVWLCILGNVLAGEFYNRTPYDMDEPLEPHKGALIQLSCDVTSRPARMGQSAEYQINVENLSDKIQTVTLAFKPDSWAIMPVTVVPETLTLTPRQRQRCTVRMTVVDKIPAGGRELRVLTAGIGEQYPSQELELVTIRFLDHPNMFLNETLIADVRQKIENYPWAKKNYEQLKKEADGWDSPAEKKYTIRREGIVWQGLFPNYITERAWKTAIVWKLTGDSRYRDKLLTFIRAVADPQKGYASTRWATNSDAYVHEGEFFTFYSALYDVLYNDPGLSESDHNNIESALRLYLKTCRMWHRGGDIGNWVISANAGAICASIVLQDMQSLDYFLNCPKGFKEQLSLGLMADGWWFEGASNYSYLAARYYGYAAKCCEPFGINLFEMYVPARYLGQAGRRWKNGWMSMNFDIWGPAGKSYRCLKDLYEGAIILMDENGWVAANNDSEPKKPDDVYELAYYHYQEPKYLWIIDKDQRTSWQSLLYGTAETKGGIDPRSISGHADNVGIAALRSQGKDQKPNEQIQAFLKWGTHGGWHGHFDRAGILMLRRYGVNFFLPRPDFFGYSDPRYKAWVQPSISHNMVIVDQYQQEPVESKLLLFYGGTAIQACAVETNARWIEKLPWDINNPGDLDAANMKKMADYGDAEPVLQRRLMIVTEDYVLISDYLCGAREHTFDWLVHPVGYLGTVCDDMKEIKLTDKMSDDPNSSYYYVTDCRWYDVSRNVLNQFEDSNVHLDIRCAFDGPMEMAVGADPHSKPSPENKMRRMLLFRNRGKEFRFVSLFEPYREKAVVKRFEADQKGAIIVQLADGRTQKVTINGFDCKEGTPKINFEEIQNGHILRRETAEGISK